MICAKHFVYVNSFKPHIMSTNQILLSHFVDEVTKPQSLSRFQKLEPEFEPSLSESSVHAFNTTLYNILPLLLLKL